MQFQKFVDRIKYIEDLIEREATGTPNELATKLQISERMIYRYIQVLADNGKRIKFCPIKKSYTYHYN